MPMLDCGGDIFWALEKVYSEALKSTSEDRSGA